MARPAPRDPEMLAALVATLRATADGTSASTGPGAVADRVRHEADPAIAAKLVANFDRINPAIRRSAMGEWFDHPADFTPAGTVDTGVGRGTALSGGGIAGRLDRAGLSLGDSGPTTVSDGSAPATPTPPTYTVTYRGM